MLLSLVLSMIWLGIPLPVEAESIVVPCDPAFLRMAIEQANANEEADTLIRRSNS
jgi:hypothetical protein